MSTESINASLVELGNAVIESDGHGGFLVMFPNGTVKPYCGFPRAINGVKAWFEKRTPKTKISVGTVTAYGETAREYFNGKGSA